MGAWVSGVCVVWLAALCVFDIRERRLPNWLTMPGAAVILATAAMHGRGGPAVLGAVALVRHLCRRAPGVTRCDGRR
jgi:leader peptidase (prepilin peptidase)/N-methyltransferase